MANHKIELPEDFRAFLTRQVVDCATAQFKSELPSYPIFVNNLMKGLPTAAEELHHAATGISGEAGEILDLSKKVWIYGKDLDLPHLIEELGDLRFYYQAALNMLGITDDDVRAANIVKLRKRYEAGVYSDKAAIERKDKQPLSAEGSKGAATPAPRKFMGQPAPGKSKPAQEGPTEENTADKAALDAMHERIRATVQAAEAEDK